MPDGGGGRRRQAARRALTLGGLGSGLLGSGLLVTVGGCAATGALADRAGDGAGTAPRSAAPGRAGYADDDPVVVSTRSGRPLSRESWQAQLQRTPIVLLGEIHDNPRHHRIRAALVRLWGAGAQPTRPAIVFEHLDRAERDALVAATDRPPAERMPLERLLEIGGFDARGWAWPVHRPLFEATREVDAVWIAAGIPRQRRPAPGPDGDGVRLDRDRLDRIIAEADWPASAQTALERSLVDGHCGQLPASAIPTMVTIQRRRDASLAEPALVASGRRTLVLAGNGHVGRVHGVPRYLAAPADGTLAVGFLERTSDGSPDTAALAEDFDWVIVTEATPREDPCLAFSRSAPTQTRQR